MIEHKVESGRDVILDGTIYHPDINKRVFLPRLFATDECVPVVQPAQAAEQPAGRGRRNAAEPQPVTPEPEVASDMDAGEIEEALNG